MLTLSALVVACGPDDEVPEPTGQDGSCAGSTTEQSATPVATHTTLEGCGDSFLGPFEILGEGTFELSLYTDGERLVPNVKSLENGGVLLGVRARGTFVLEGKEALRFWRLPYDGAGEAGVFPLGAPELDADGWPALPEVADDPHDTSSWAGLLARDEGGALLVGALSGLSSRVTVAFDEDGTSWLVWGGRGEGIRLDAGQNVYLDPLHVAIGADPEALWAEWADRVLVASRGVAPTAPPIVGGSTEDLAAPAAGDALGAVRADRWVLVGPGWETAPGDWTPNARFPEGLAPIAAAARAAGGHAAVWMAPFLLDPGAPVLAEHPDWAVPGVTRDGLAVLDPSRPDALAWLVEQVTARVDEGFEAIELGSASAGAVRGEAPYRAALQALRTAVGPDVRLLLAEAPLLPSVGLADGVRLGAGEAWPGDADRRAALARDRAGLAFVNARWWWNDPGLATTADGLAAALGSGGLLRVPSGAPDLLGEELAELTGVPTRPVPWSEAPTTIEAEAWTVLQNPGAAPITVPGPGGTELGSGDSAAPGERTLQPGAAEVWIPEGQ